MGDILPGALEEGVRTPLLSGSQKDKSATVISVESQPSDGDKLEPLTPRHWHLHVFIVFAVYVAAAYAMYVPFTDHFAGHKTNPWVDAAYFSVVTVTSVGYGDIVPTTPTSKILISIFAFLGIGLVFTVLSWAGLHLLDRQEEMIRKEVERLTKEDLEGDSGLRDAATQGHIATFRVSLAVAAIAGQLLLGTLVLTWAEGLSLVDAIYCACVTVTTVGYGDLGFATLFGRHFGIVWLLTSTVTVGWALGAVVDVHLHSRQTAFTIAHLSRQVTRRDIAAADSDRDGKLAFAEFCLLKFTEMERVNRAEIEEMRTFFDAQDKDRSGHLDISEVVL